MGLARKLMYLVGAALQRLPLGSRGADAVCPSRTLRLVHTASACGACDAVAMLRVTGCHTSPEFSGQAAAQCSVHPVADV